MLLYGACWLWNQERRYSARSPSWSSSPDEFLQKIEKCLVVLRELCQGRFPVFGFPDDGHAETVKGPNVDILAQVPAEAFVDPLLHLLSRIPREGQQEQLGRMQAAVCEPAGLGHDHRGLAAAGRGDNQVASFVGDHCPALLFGQWPAFDPVEVSLQPRQFVLNEYPVRFRSRAFRRHQGSVQLLQHPDGWMPRKLVRQRPRNPLTASSMVCTRADPAFMVT